MLQLIFSLISSVLSQQGEGSVLTKKKTAKFTYGKQFLVWGGVKLPALLEIHQEVGLWQVMCLVRPLGSMHKKYQQPCPKSIRESYGLPICSVHAQNASAVYVTLKENNYFGRKFLPYFC